MLYIFLLFNFLSTMFYVFQSIVTQSEYIILVNILTIFFRQIVYLSTHFSYKIILIVLLIVKIYLIIDKIIPFIIEIIVFLIFTGIIYQKNLQEQQHIPISKV